MGIKAMAELRMRAARSLSPYSTKEVFGSLYKRTLNFELRPGKVWKNETRPPRENTDRFGVDSTLP